MKKLRIKDSIVVDNNDFIDQYLQKCKSKTSFVEEVKDYLSDLRIEFYDYVGLIFSHIGFPNPHVTREGDVNCRFDATLIDGKFTIPIEIKSPREDREINIKSIRQAFENKIVLLSRKFYPTQQDTTSLALAFEYPPSRSDIYELIDNIKDAFGYNIGIINIDDLLNLVYDIQVNHRVFNFKYFYTLKGQFEYEKAFITR